MRVNNYYSYNESSKNSMVIPIFLAISLGIMCAILLRTGVNLLVVLFGFLIKHWIWALVGIAIIIGFKKYFFSRRRPDYPMPYAAPEGYQ